MRRRRGARPAEDGLPRPAQPRRDRRGGAAGRRPRHLHDPARRPRRPTRCSRAATSTGVFQFESSGMREALRQVKPTEFEDLIALVALYRPGPMGYIPVYARRKNGQEQRRRTSTSGWSRSPGDRTGSASTRSSTWRSPSSSPGSRPAEADDLRKAIGKKIHALMASLKDKFLEGCAAERRHARGREPALEGHGAGAGLLLQQVARRLLRADRLPHRVPEGAPPGRVHGRAHLLRDEHEGPRAVLRQRVRRDGDRGAAAGRELVRRSTSRSSRARSASA